MAATKPTRESRMRYYTVEDANRALPYVRAIVADIVREYRVVEEMRQRLSTISRDKKKKVDDVYNEELAHFEAELEAQEASLGSYLDELAKLGVELKGTDGLCDFYSLKDGREVYLCWRLGEPEVAHWHELNAGFAGRQPLGHTVGGTR